MSSHGDHKIYRMLSVEHNAQILVLWFMVFNATFSDISVISGRPVLLVEETGVPGENHRPVASH